MRALRYSEQNVHSCTRISFLQERWSLNAHFLKMVNTLFFLFINLFLLFCLITTSSAPDNGTPAQCKFSVSKKRSNSRVQILHILLFIEKRTVSQIISSKLEEPRTVIYIKLYLRVYSVHHKIFLCITPGFFRIRLKFLRSHSILFLDVSVFKGQF